MDDHDPTLPWVIKWNSVVNLIAGDVNTFVDDLRANGFSTENAWQIGRRIASRLQHLGLQDAAQKTRPPSSSPGAWAGSVQKITADKVCATSTQEKWTKGRNILLKYFAMVEGGDPIPPFPYKQLRSDVGFLVHKAMTYSDMMPFLKGFYLTLNSWRPDRNKEG
jgi:hypothetical protein